MGNKNSPTPWKISVPDYNLPQPYIINDKYKAMVGCFYLESDAILASKAPEMVEEIKTLKKLNERLILSIRELNRSIDKMWNAGPSMRIVDEQLEKLICSRQQECAKLISEI